MSRVGPAPALQMLAPGLPKLRGANGSYPNYIEEQRHVLISQFCQIAAIVLRRAAPAAMQPTPDTTRRFEIRLNASATAASGIP